MNSYLICLLAVLSLAVFQPFSEALLISPEVFTDSVLSLAPHEYKIQTNAEISHSFLHQSAILKISLEEYIYTNN